MLEKMIAGTFTLLFALFAVVFAFAFPLATLIIVLTLLAGAMIYLERD